MRILFIIIFSISLNSFAQGDLADITKHVQENDTIVGEDQYTSEKIKELPLPKSLNFLLGFRDLVNFNESLDFDNYEELSELVLSSNDMYLYFDSLYLEAQEFCYDSDLNEDDFAKCERIVLKMEKLSSAVEAKAELTPGGTVADLFGIDTSGANLTRNEIQADPNREYNDGQLDEDRYSPVNKGFVDIEETQVNQESLDVSMIICRYVNQAELNLPKGIVLELISMMEQAYLDESVSVKEREEIHCLLLDYYQTNELYLKLDFLFLNFPDPDRDISCN